MMVYGEYLPAPTFSQALAQPVWRKTASNGRSGDGTVGKSPVHSPSGLQCAAPGESADRSGRASDARVSLMTLTNLPARCAGTPDARAHAPNHAFLCIRITIRFCQAPTFTCPALQLEMCIRRSLPQTMHTWVRPYRTRFRGWISSTPSMMILRGSQQRKNHRPRIVSWPDPPTTMEVRWPAMRPIFSAATGGPGSRGW